MHFYLIKSHLNHSIQNNNDDGILLLFPRLFSFASKPFTAHPSQSPHLELTSVIKLPIKSQSDNCCGKVIGSVNGLKCFKYGSNHDSQVIYGSNHDPEVIYIWNPSLSTLLTLPPYYNPSHSIQQFFRFGFDPKTDDYKVVKITRRIDPVAAKTKIFKNCGEHDDDVLIMMIVLLNLLVMSTVLFGSHLTSSMR